MKNIITQITERMGADFQNSEAVKDFLCDINFKAEDLKGREGNDFRSDRDEQGHCWRDIVEEWADSQTSDGSDDLWNNARDFIEWTERWIGEFGFEEIAREDSRIEALFYHGECLCWEAFAGEILSALRELTK